MRAILAVFGAAIALTACASTDAVDSDSGYDPLEGWNRGVFGFNNAVDAAVLEPVAKGYRTVTNEPIRGGVTNFLRNLRQPVVFTNTFMQGNPGASVETAGRFLLNTTVGIGGIFDPASAVGIPEHREDFGQTLGVWGFSEGAYLMLPFAGPSNVRDLFGLGFDYATNPINIVEFESDTEIRTGLGIIGAISARESLIEQVEVLREQPEPYVALRRNYTQQRQAAIRNGEEEEDPFANLPEFDDFEFEDEEDFN